MPTKRRVERMTEAAQPKPPIHILEADDPRVEAYRSLRERDAVGRRQGFIAEGATVLVNAIRAGRYPLRSVLLSQKRHARLADLLEALQPDVPVYVADQPVLDAICGFDLHRGVLALGARPILPDPGELLAGMAERSTVVCLIGINDVENMGSIFRNAAALGAQGVLLDDSCCDPLYRRAIRVSVGACLTVPFARFAGGDLLELLAHHRFQPLAFTPAGSTSLKVEPSVRNALLFGAEGPGLPPDLLAGAATVRIPMAGGFDSLNVAAASAIALHHLIDN
jgi:tRNA G18 (ribose-2'-O)-methylase SpoU